VIRDLIEPETAAELLGKSVRTLARYADLGFIWCTRTGNGHRRYDRDDVIAFRERNGDFE
jgi:DNA-binding transcriptional MerR regulator